jgi:hypothetical protein
MNYGLRANRITWRKPLLFARALTGVPVVDRRAKRNPVSGVIGVQRAPHFDGLDHWITAVWFSRLRDRDISGGNIML